MREVARPRVDARLVEEVARRLTERDRFLIRLIGEHRVLTTDHVVDLAFVSRRRAELRLTELYQLRVLERFRPFRTTGSAPYHYVLDEVGVRLLAVEGATEPKTRSWRRSNDVALSGSQHLAHLVAVNGFFAALVASARRRPGCALTQWWSERRCVERCGGLVRPDGFGVWTEGADDASFFLELDNDTETTSRVVRKFDDYEELAQRTGERTLVLLSLASVRREASIRIALLAERAREGVAIATGVRGSISPDGTAWLPLGGDPARRRLIELRAERVAD